MKDFLFDPKLLSDSCVDHGPGSGFVLRPLRASDYSRQYLQLLAQLTVVGDIDEPSFRGKFFSSVRQPNSCYGQRGSRK